MARTVEYLINLLDRFSGPATKVAAEAKKAGAAATQMGAAFNKAEAAVNRTGAAMTMSSRRQAEAAKRANALWIAEANKIEKIQQGMLRRQEARRQLQEKGLIGKSGGSKTGVFGHAMNAWGTVMLADMAVGAADHFVESMATVDTIAKKMKQAGLSGPEIAKARSQAEKMTDKFGNMSVAENMELIYDARANLIGSFDQILHEVDTFARLGSFFKAWDGGSHSGAEKDILKELNFAMRSGELAGNVSAEDLGKHANALAKMKVLYGDKLKVSDYFAAQQTAAAALTATDDKFKFVDFPALVQALGPRAGSGLATLTNKTVAGIMVRQTSAEAWRRLGMVNMDAVDLDKKGKIDIKSLGRGWLKGGDLAGKNPFEWMMTEVLPRLGSTSDAQLRVAGVDPAKIKAAWASQDPMQLLDAVKGIDKNQLRASLGKLGYDKTAVMNMVEMILRSPMILRDREMMQQIQNDMENFINYDKAKQDLGTSFNTMMLNLTGKGFTPWVTQQLQNAKGIVDTISKTLKNNPGIGEWLGKGLLAGGGLLGLAAAFRTLRGLARFTGISSLAGWLWRVVGAGNALKALGPIGAGLFIAYTAYENWEKLAGAISRAKKAFDEFGASAAAKSLISDAADRLSSLFSEYKTFLRALPVVGSAVTGADILKGAYDSIGSANAATAPRGGYLDGLAAVAAQAQREISIRVEAPKDINVKVDVSGAGLSGSGSGTLPLSANAPRGRTMATPPAPVVPR